VTLTWHTAVLNTEWNGRYDYNRNKQNAQLHLTENIALIDTSNQQPFNNNDK